jgi:signal transduction histidine kinase
VIAHLAWVLIFSVLHARGRGRSVRTARAQHEVRGPLTVAQLALSGLERTARVEAIDLELRRAALALDDLVGPGRARRREPVDLGRLVADAAPAWRALADRRGGMLTVESVAAPVRGDALRLAQACANLVANAIEHGGGRVHIRASAGGGHVRVEVSDDGPGLPAPVPVLLAAGRSRRSHRGHGLAIAAAIARSHGGRLTSAPSHVGARLVLEFPAAPTRRAS